MISSIEKVVVLLPVYKPDEELIALCRTLSGIRAVIIDSGSGREYEDILNRASEYGEVLRLEKKGDRGESLKRGLSYILEKSSYDDVQIIVTGSLGVSGEDLLRVAEKTAECGGLVHGVRKGDVSGGSKLGRGLTDLVFRIGAGKGISDTLSGVRGFTRALAEEYVSLSGNRFEFEMIMLFDAVEEKTVITEVETAEGKKDDGFRFHPLLDMIRVYWTVFMESRTLKYIFSSGVAFIIDLTIFGLLSMFFGWLFSEWIPVLKEWAYLPATVSSWIVSSLTNFFMNRNFVFRSNVPLKIALPEYYGLAAVVFGMKTLLLTLMIKVLRIPDMISKIVAEILFFISNYFIQKKFIFKKKAK